MPFYNRVSAITYAVTWAKLRNPVWFDYSGHHGGGDCTNFISQCLYAGGWNMRYDALMGANPYAWYCWPERGGWDHSRTWASADNFAYFLKISGRARPCGFDELMLGDLVLETIGEYGIRHVMMVTLKTSQDIFLSYHSTDYLNTPFKDVQTRVGQYNSLSFMKLLDTYTDDERFYMPTTTTPGWGRDPPSRVGPPMNRLIHVRQS
jgi:hypothetical protein